jgi:hypothetical protein
MNRTSIQGGMTPAEYYSAMNTNYQKSYLGGNWFNVEEYGTLHDDLTDDTVAIQDTINACFIAGGGTVFFPKGVYKIAGELQTNVGGINYNSQLYIPFNASTDRGKAIRFLGEVPNPYSTRRDDDAQTFGVVLHSTITGTGVRPSVIGASEDTLINYTAVEIENITITVDPFKDSNGPSMSGINFRLLSHSKIKNLICKVEYGTDETTLVQPENHVFGLLIGAKNGDFPIINFYKAVGFYYGIIIGEGVHAKDIFCCFNYIGLMSMIPNYGSVVEYATLHWNTYDIASLQETIGVLTAGITNLNINHLSSEDNDNRGPVWTHHVDEILDEDNLLQGKMEYYIAGSGGVGAGNNIVKSHGGNNFLIRNHNDINSSFHWSTTERPTNPGHGCTGYNTTTDKLECWDGATWNDLF